MTTQLSPDESITADHEEADSPVIQALRAREKELAKQLKAAETKAEQADANARLAIQREVTAHQIVSGLGLPKLAPLVVEKIQGDITEESVKSLLDGFGLLPQAGSTQPSQPQLPQLNAAEVASVASLGAQLASASRDPGGQSVMQRIQNAASAAEVAAIAAEAGIATSY